MPARPQDLIFTLYGEYLLHRKKPIWVGSLIALLQPFDLSEGAVRTVLSRMARKGWLKTHRTGKHSFYDLAPKGRQLLEDGEDRIFHPSWDNPWDGSWFLIAYSIPEDIRHLRDRLRDRLAWLGFGSLGNGLWISPHDVEEQVQRVAKQLKIERHLECFQARRVNKQDVQELVAKCWDLATVNQQYLAFSGRWQSELERCSPGVPTGDVTHEECFAVRFDLIHEYRAFPLIDPYLPRSLLPEKWNGEDATKLFHILHEILKGPADSYVDQILNTERL